MTDSTSPDTRPEPLAPEQLLQRFKDLGIETVTHEHPPLMTVEDSKRLRGDLPGGHCKNLFLKDRKDRYWLVVTSEDRKVDLKALDKLLGTRLSFASAERLWQVLGIRPGAVTPFALVNDRAGDPPQPEIRLVDALDPAEPLAQPQRQPLLRRRKRDRGVEAFDSTRSVAGDDPGLAQIGAPAGIGRLDAHRHLQMRDALDEACGDHGETGLVMGAAVLRRRLQHGAEDADGFGEFACLPLRPGGLDHRRQMQSGHARPASTRRMTEAARSASASVSEKCEGSQRPRSEAPIAASKPASSCL